MMIIVINSILYLSKVLTDKNKVNFIELRKLLSYTGRLNFDLGRTNEIHHYSLQLERASIAKLYI